MAARVDRYEPSGEVRSCYQARFWARVELDEWRPEHETFDRRIVPSERFFDTLTWGDAKTAAVILEEGRRLDAQARDR